MRQQVDLLKILIRGEDALMNELRYPQGPSEAHGEHSELQGGMGMTSRLQLSRTRMIDQGESNRPKPEVLPQSLRQRNPVEVIQDVVARGE